MNNDMSWATGLIFCGLTFCGIAAAYCYAASRSEKFICNRKINEFRVTPKFDNDEESL